MKLSQYPIFASIASCLKPKGKSWINATVDSSWRSQILKKQTQCYNKGSCLLREYPKVPKFPVCFPCYPIFPCSFVLNFVVVIALFFSKEQPKGRQFSRFHSLAVWVYIDLQPGFVHNRLQKITFPNNRSVHMVNKRNEMSPHTCP